MANMRRNRSGLPKHCSWNYDRHGKRRVRFRKSGFTTYLAGLPYSDDFNCQYWAALEGVKKKSENIGAELRTKPGSLNELCVAYYRSPGFLDLKASTKDGRRGIIEGFRKLHGDKPVAKLARTHIEQIIAAKAETPNAANSLLKVLRLLLNHAVNIEMIAANPALGIKRFKIRSDGYPPWTEDEIARFEARYPVGSKARLAFALLLYTAQRVSDVIAMGRQHVVGDAIKVKQEKTGTTLLIPIHPELKTILAAAERKGLLFLTTGRGTAFSRQVFTKWFRQQCDRAGIADRSAHGLRKSAPIRLANAGCTAHEIAAVTGHRSLREVEHYTRAADQERLARQAMRRMEAEQELSNLSTRLDKKAKKR
jgi:integrase